MKIVFLVRTLQRGGAQRQLVLLAQGLQARGHDVAVIVFYANGAFETELRAAQVPVFVLHRKSRWDVFALWRELVRIVHTLQPQIIHGYLETPNVLAAILRRKVPGAKVVFGVRASQVQYERYDWAFRVMSWLESYAARWADISIANSHAGARTAIAAGFPAQRMKVIHNGIDPQRFYPDPQLRAAQREAWGIAAHETLIGLVGRIDPKKDHATFLQAAAIVRQQQSQVRFVCIGGGTAAEMTPLYELSARLDLVAHVLWVPTTDQMNRVYNALDILCSASAFGEGFSNVIGEAMACGVPCVVTDVGDSARIVLDTGMIAAPGDAHSLAQQLLHCLAADRTALSLKTRQRILKEFSVESLLTKTESELRALLSVNESVSN